MLLSESENKEQIHSFVVEELRTIGIKYRNEKKSKIQNNHISKKIFNTSLHRLELKHVILSSGSVVLIPVFIADCCDKILESVDTEGIFRKTGNLKRQREVKIALERGSSLDKYKLNVLDIACLLKTFFRELPEPIIAAGNLQEIFVRCLLCQSQDVKVEALLMSCLLLPPLSLNTLAYFLQFLKTVSKHSNQNRMTIQNLSVLWSENLMPVPLDAPNNRLTSHHKVVELLIDSSSHIGIVPERFLKRLEEISSPSQSSSIQAPTTDKKKKKGRRSASLTRVFHGIKKAWNGAIGSSESLDKSNDNLEETSVLATPCITKSSKKRKITENLTSFSAKKKKNVLSALPQSDLLPKTPHHQKEFKKTRLSLGGRKFGVRNENESERRWSIVGPSWKSKKNLNKKVKEEKSKLSPVKSLPNLMEQIAIVEEEKRERMTDDEEYVKIPKSEFEAFKERVSAIETRISQEFNSVKLDSIKGDFNDSPLLNGPEKVGEKFQKTLQEVESIENFGSVDDQLSKRLSRELKIRRSVESRVMRSPSARKIGSIRRRSKEGQRLSRNQSWHLGTSIVVQDESKPSTFYPKSNLRRGRPNTVQSGLKHTPVTPVQAAPSVNSSEVSENETWMSADAFFSDPSNDQHDVSTDVEKTTDEIDENVFKTPNARMKSLSIRSAAKPITVKTPMLPPTLPPRRTPSTATKNSPMPFSKTPVRVGEFLLNKSVLTPVQDFSQGRASIARIRSQNAGMVLQKAKLFDGLGKEQPKSNSKLYVTRIDVQISSHENSGVPEIPAKPLVNKTLENVKKCDTPRKNSPKKKNQSNNSPKSPKSPAGVNRRQKLRSTQSPHALKTVRDRSSRINTENRFKNKINLLNQELLEEICSPKAKKQETNFPVIRKPLAAQNSPRRLMKTPVKDKARTPLKAMHLKHSPSRQSPRLSMANRKTFKNVY